MTSYEYSTGTETEEELELEWSAKLEKVHNEQTWDEEGQHLLDLMRSLNVGYSPLQGYADGFMQRRWDRPTLRICDVLKPQAPGRPGLNLTDERINDFVEVATAYAYHYRPRWVSTKYIHGIAAEMIRHHYDVQVL